MDLSQNLRDNELQVKSLLLLDEVQRAMKKQKSSRYSSIRKTFRRLKKGSLRLVYTRHSLPTKQQKYEAGHVSTNSLSYMGWSGDTPMIKPHDQKDRVKLGAWSPGLKRWVNDSGCATPQGDGSSVGWAPPPVVIHNAMATHNLDDGSHDDGSHFSVRDSVHGYLNDNKQLSYQLEDVLMSAAAKTTDEGIKAERPSSTISLYSHVFGGWRHIQELRVIGQDMCKPAVALGLSDGGDEWKEWVLSPNDDR